jgi:Tol biopolymer transport system component
LINLIKIGLVSLLMLGCSLTAMSLPSATSIQPTQETLVLPSTTDTEIIPILTPIVEDSPPGKIAYTCQLSGIRYQDQICIINADGTGFMRLTGDDTAAHFYPSIAPDGKSIVYSANPTGTYEIYEADLQGNSQQLTHGLGTLTSPEISPDGNLIAFTLGDGQSTSIGVMDRDGSQPGVVYGPGWDPTWSPDGGQILFASYDQNKAIQLFTVNLDGTHLRQITQMKNLRGRSDWSPDGKWAVTYSGEPWGRELFTLPIDGGEPRQLSPTGGNSQGPSISPDGKWVVFTAYFGDIGNDDGCEIYIIRTDGTQLTRLTENTFCDWQPRWGP